MLGPDESIYTMAANSVLDLIIENNIDPKPNWFFSTWALNPVRITPLEQSSLREWLMKSLKIEV